MKIKLTNIRPDVDGRYDLESIVLDMPQVTFSVEHCLSFTLRKVNNFTIKQVIDYKLAPNILKKLLKRFLVVLDEATKDRRRNISMSISSDGGTLELIGKRNEMDIIANLFNEKLNR